jgi:hypothetical protein
MHGDARGIHAREQTQVIARGRRESIVVRALRLAQAIALCALTSAVLIPNPALAEKVLLWGDTHVHTHYSTDSFIQQNFDTGPDAAYRFARGLPVRHPTTDTRVRIETPLDFLVVSDHAESYGMMRRAILDGLPREGLGPIDRMKSWAMEKFFRYLAENPGSITTLLDMASPETTDVVEAARTPASMRTPNDQIVAHETWIESTDISDSHNDPGIFTTLIGWEWSAIPAGSNLHRVVFTQADATIAQQFTPFSSSESSYPEDLWAWLEATSDRTGADFVAIPHNSNISRGFMFPSEKRLRDTPLDREWIERRARWERVVEATQIKGDSETHPALSPDDPFANFESYPHYISPQLIPYAPGPGDFVRSALRRGLEVEDEFGANPYRFGLIGSTDSHTGLATAEEPNFWGKFPTDSVLEGKLETTSRIENFGWAMSASGLAAVWAEENTREAIFRAFQRGEVYATTGTRIGLRVRALTKHDPAATVEDLVRSDEIEAVPMGGMLGRQERAPTLLIEASKDPKGANLDRVQVIKGWLEDGNTFEHVYDVVWAGDRTRARDGSIPTLPDTVDRETGRASNEHGAATLSALWRDPDFDPAQPSFYYVRVLEVPSPRHSTLDAIALGRDPSTTGHPVSIQERAYASPIHYRP